MRFSTVAFAATFAFAAAQDLSQVPSCAVRSIPTEERRLERRTCLDQLAYQKSFLC